MANCSYKKKMFDGEKWECPLEALVGEESCYWHRERYGKKPTEEMLSELTEKELFGVYLHGANLQGADLHDANLQGAHLLSAKLQGADLSGANLQQADLGGANLSRANLSGANLRQTDLWWAKLQEADLGGANLQQANLKWVEFQEANLSGANLQQADLEKAELRGANLSGANLQQADLEGADFQEANLRGVALQEANLRSASLRESLLSSADLKNAILADADLRGVDLSHADLRGVNLSHAVVTGVRLEEAILDEKLINEVKGDRYKKEESYESAFKKYYEAFYTYQNLEYRFREVGIYEKSSAYYIAQWRVKGKIQYLASKIKKEKLHEISFLQYFLPLSFKWKTHEKIFVIIARLESKIRWFINKILDFAVLYGESPSRVIVTDLFIMFFYALSYWLFSGITHGSVNFEPSFLESLYFSIVTFTTLGYGDYHPKPAFQIVATSEAFIGAFMMAFFVVVVSRKLIR